VPKGLLQEARTGELEMKSKSLQVPKPGYCYVRDEKGEDKFQLYFNGGTERKLQIKHLRKEYCRLHAAWRFPAVDLS
jgi:type II restriction enzyme